ncbi:MAG: phosphonate metabolism protein/1,5-bisphosphokinase (PRPP-forming) PhnN [Pseudomonadota bacterium]
MHRRLIVVVGPSGAGKDTLLKRWRERLAPAAPLHFARRLITRPADPLGERHEPVTHAQLQALRASGALAFEWQAHGLAYAVHREALAPLGRGEWVVLNGSRDHLPTLRAQAPGCRVVEVTAPPALLLARLQARARESADALQARLRRETAPVQPDLTLVNDGDPAECVRALHAWWLAQQR